jgi:acetoin utilization deacetylase AcuC-like enzyme
MVVAPPPRRPLTSHADWRHRDGRDAAVRVTSGMTVAFISHPDCGRHDTGWEHPEHVGRLRAIPSALKYHPALFHALQHREGRHATPDELALAHDADYIASVRELAAAGGGRLDPDTVVSEGTWDAVTAGAGCVLDAVDLVMTGEVRRAFCAVRPPGHHAVRDRAMGFCLFGNVAIGALHALARHGAERVLIVDWDVHHGNGTQALVEHEPRIRFVSIHQWPWYPGTGAADDRGPHGSIWNVPMPAGEAPATYTAALWEAIDEATRDWTPDLVLISAGFDSLAGDPLGGFTWRIDDLSAIARGLCERANSWCGGRVVSALEGGYAPEQTAEAVIAHLQVLVDA